jgi:hypothetical protein
MRDDSHPDCGNYLKVLQTAQKEFLARKTKGHDIFLDDIVQEWDNSAASRISVIKAIRTTARVKGLFSRMKEFNDHELKTSSILANSIRLTRELHSGPAKIRISH